MKDLKGTLSVKVTKADIARALEIDPNADDRERTCPIAQALHRIGFHSAIVCTNDFRLDPFGRYYGLPERAERFVEKFDNGIPVRGFTFEVVL